MTVAAARRFGVELSRLFEFGVEVSEVSDRDLSCVLIGVEAESWSRWGCLHDVFQNC